jgi:hypothetical protein
MKNGWRKLMGAIKQIEILEVTTDPYYEVVTKTDIYRRFGDYYWVQMMGASWEEIEEDQELEKAFRDYLGIDEEDYDGI